MLTNQKITKTEANYTFGLPRLPEDMHGILTSLLGFESFQSRVDNEHRLDFIYKSVLYTVRLGVHVWKHTHAFTYLGVGVQPLGHHLRDAPGLSSNGGRSACPPSATPLVFLWFTLWSLR